MTILVAVQALLPRVTFRLSPQAALAYLQTLHYVSTYQGMTLDRFLMYRNESLREIIQAYNKNDAGGSLDPVLKVVIKKNKHTDQSMRLRLRGPVSRFRVVVT